MSKTPSLDPTPSIFGHQAIFLFSVSFVREETGFIWMLMNSVFPIIVSLSPLQDGSLQLIDKV